MLGHTTPVVRRGGEIPQWVWQENDRRRPRCAWRVEVAVENHGHGCLLDAISKITSLGRKSTVKNVFLTSEEMERILRVLTHGHRTATKTTIVSANVMSACKDLWQRGTPEHLAMRELAPWAVSQALGARRTHIGGWVPWACLQADHVANYYPLVHHGACEDAPQQEAGNEDPGPPSAPAGIPPGLPAAEQQGPTADEVGRNAPKGPGPNELPEKADPTDNPHPNGGEDAADKEMREVANGRILATEAANVVLGFDHGEGPLQQRGVITGPIAKIPLIYANSDTNVEEAIKKRIKEKQLAWKGTEKDKKDIKQLIKEATRDDHPDKLNYKNLFSAQKIRDYLSNVLFKEMKSKKWGDKRFEAALLKVAQTVDPYFTFSAAVKAEPMPEGKAPRMLIADGDDGQLLALMTIKVFEELLFHHMEEHSVKHKSKREAMTSIAEQMTLKGKRTARGVGVIEGDGSAWDTCCNRQVREQVENPILRHIANIIAEFTEWPCEWADAHIKANEKKTLKLKLPSGYFVKIDAIRRSGHRGTSCLNWWMNYVLWMVCLYGQQAHNYLSAKTIKGTDRWGETRLLKYWFEGDDSLLCTSPKVETASQSNDIMAFWTRMGFHMKLVYADTVATFTGWRFQVGVMGCTGVCAPDVKRCMESSGVSCSPEVRAAAREGNREKLMRMAGSSALARAHEYAGILPSVSNKFLEYALSLGYNADSHELKMVTQHDKEGPLSLEDTIRVLNGAVEPTSELKTMYGIGYAAKPTDIEAFALYPWDMTHLDTEAFVLSLPPSWRPGGIARTQAVVA
jgi:hypothetical protein